MNRSTIGRWRGCTRRASTACWRSRAATERRGGRWFLDRSPDFLKADAFLLSDDGVIVDAALPPAYGLNTGAPPSQAPRWDPADEDPHNRAFAAVRAAQVNPAAPRQEVTFRRTIRRGTGWSNCWIINGSGRL